MKDYNKVNRKYIDIGLRSNINDNIYIVSQDYTSEGIYVIEFVDRSVKIGRSVNLKQRLKVYKNPWVKEISFIKTYGVKNSVIFENYICNKFKSYKSLNSREHFKNISVLSIIEFIESDKFFTNKKKTNKEVNRKVKSHKAIKDNLVLDFLYITKDFK